MNEPVVAVPTPRLQGPGARGELVGIQYLRGIAALMVVIFHLAPQLAKMGRVGSWPWGLDGGVDIFFIISGLIMWVTTRKPIGPVEFWRRRATRIVPLYWIITSVMIAIGLILPRALSTPLGDVAYLAKSYLLIPAANPTTHDIMPVVPLGWTLECEVMFYLIFGLALLAPVRRQLALVIGALVLLVGVGVVLGLSLRTTNGFYTAGIMLEFAWGVALGAVLDRGGVLDRASALTGWLIAATGMILFFFMPLGDEFYNRAVFHGVPATMVVAGVLIVEIRGRLPRVAVLRALGDSSYSLYLLQLLSLAAVTMVWHAAHLDRSGAGLVLYCAVATVATVVAAFVCFKLVEQPLQKLLRCSPPDGARLARVSVPTPVPAN